MPTYDYKCLDCGDRFEHFQGMLEKPLEKCQKCSGSLIRLIGPGAGPIFKGSGFYQTDYKKPGAKNLSDSKTSGKPDSGDKPSNDTGEKTTSESKNKKPA